MSAELERLLRERRECNARLIVDQLRSAELKHAISAMHERNRQAEASRRIAAEEARIAKSKYPAEGSEGWSVDADGEIHRVIYSEHFPRQKRLVDAGNWHPTREAAERARDAWLGFIKLRKAGLRLRHNGIGDCVVVKYDKQATAPSLAAWHALPPEQRVALAEEA